MNVNNCRHQANWETEVKGRNVYSRELTGRQKNLLISISSESLPSLVALTSHKASPCLCFLICKTGIKLLLLPTSLTHY